MKRYIRASNSSLEAGNPLLKYYDLYEDDESFMRDVGLSAEENVGFEIGSSLPGYEDYVLVAHAVAKDKYAEALGEDGYDIVDVYDHDGELTLGLVIGERLYDIGEDIEYTLEAYRDRQ